MVMDDVGDNGVTKPKAPNGVEDGGRVWTGLT